MDIVAYSERWELVSWDLSEAVTAFYALLAAGEWQKSEIQRLSEKKHQSNDAHQHAIVIISNSIVSHFFITASRIREQKYTDLNLYTLHKEAGCMIKEASHLNKDIEGLMKTTKEKLNMIQGVRGATVAHLKKGETPFTFMKKNGITPAYLKEYLEDCTKLYALLGRLAGRDYPTDINSYESSRSAISAAFRHLIPAS